MDFSRLKTFVLYFWVSQLLLSGLGFAAKKPLPEITLGNAKAPVTVVEYSSLSCSHCAHFHNTVLPQIKKKYVEPGLVKIIFRDFPSDLASLRAHQLAHCLGNDKYHMMLTLLFNEQANWLTAKDPVEALKKIALNQGMNEKQFNACLKQDEYVNNIILIRKQGEQIHKIKVTPTLVINGKLHPGAMSFDQFEKAVTPYLTKQGAPKLKKTSSRQKKRS